MRRKDQALVFKKNKKTVDVGDRFVKTDDPNTVWIVAGQGAPVAAIPHFQVVREGYTNRVRTLSEQVLLDPDFYRRVE
ncbi:MAG: hypothetical protein HOH04_03100 [Rhodospirillaceae bacterium]|nr:hypothetical protein [Rhodospirillaceae bacterium]